MWSDWLNTTVIPGGLSLCRRERVKRAKKAENKAESKADKDAGASTKPTAAVVAGVANGETQKRPDLKELSKDLPSGWQVLLTRETGLCHNLIQCELSSWGNVLHQAVQGTLQSHCPFSFTSLGYGSVVLGPGLFGKWLMVHENGFNRLVGCFCRHIGTVSQQKSTMEIWQRPKPHGRDQHPQKHWHEVYLF